MASAFDSDLLGGLYADAEIAALFSDDAQIAAMLRVEAALARVQADLGLIPTAAAEAIEDVCRAPIPASALRDGIASAGVPVPTLVSELRRMLEGSPGADWVHWGATSQDIVDTGLVLRLKPALELICERVDAVVAHLAQQARAHRDLPMAARTRTQIATMTTFGARVALWGIPFLRHRDRLAALRKRLLTVSFAGASGTLSALGPDGPAVADALADKLGLARQTVPWHATRDTMGELATTCALISGSLAKVATDLALLGQSELREVSLGAGGGSSTMPHKSNPVAVETILTLDRVVTANTGLMLGAQAHGSERDGVAWGAEWHALPQIVVATGRSLALAAEIAQTMVPNPAAMAATIAGTKGLMMAEAASFALTSHIGRAAAQTLVKAACLTASETDRHLADVLAEDTDAPVDWTAVFAPAAATGSAAFFADRFVDAAAAQP